MGLFESIIHETNIYFKHGNLIQHVLHYVALIYESFFREWQEETGESNTTNWMGARNIFYCHYNMNISITRGSNLNLSGLGSCWICGGQCGTGAGFLRVLQFSLPSIPPTAPYLSTIIWGWYNRPVVASVMVDLIPLHPREGGGERTVGKFNWAESWSKNYSH
jgi:hypothetical protein